MYADLGNREVEALRNNKNPTDMLAAQFDIAKVFSAKSIDQSRAAFVLMMNGVGKIMACLDGPKKNRVFGNFRGVPQYIVLSVCEGFMASQV